MKKINAERKKSSGYTVLLECCSLTTSAKNVLRFFFVYCSKDSMYIYIYTLLLDGYVEMNESEAIVCVGKVQ